MKKSEEKVTLGQAFEKFLDNVIGRSKVEVGRVDQEHLDQLRDLKAKEKELNDDAMQQIKDFVASVEAEINPEIEQLEKERKKVWGKIYDENDLPENQRDDQEYEIERKTRKLLKVEYDK